MTDAKDMTQLVLILFMLSSSISNVDGEMCVQEVKSLWQIRKKHFNCNYGCCVKAGDTVCCESDQLGLIIGIVVVTLVGLAIMIAFLYVFWRKKSNANATNETREIPLGSATKIQRASKIYLRAKQAACQMDKRVEPERHTPDSQNMLPEYTNPIMKQSSEADSVDDTTIDDI